MTKVYTKQTIEEFLARIDTQNSEVCWISPTDTTINVSYKGEPTYLIRAIFGYFGKKYNGKLTRICKNKQCINPNHLLSLTGEEKFWSNIYIGNEDECWEWKSLSGTSRYVYTKFNGQDCGGHRLAYEIIYGGIPKGLYVCHTCDNPPCCNPNHLFLGTHQDNVDDRERKGRNRLPYSKGEDHGMHKLTVEDVKEIRRLYYSSNHTYRSLAEIYNVSFGNIRKIIKGQTWS